MAHFQVMMSVCQMPSDHLVRRLFDKVGLAVLATAWEDNARTKNSSWGPCITDMTLQVQGRRLPMVRVPNMSDLTWDVPMEQVKLLVGNERGQALHEVTLHEYLAHWQDYLREGTGAEGTLLAPSRDSQVLMSAQSCFLPVATDSAEKTPFHVALYNYQARAKDPAVLVIVSSNQGTSARVLDSQSAMKLAFNRNGDACAFEAQRLAAHRIERGKKADPAIPMDREEKAQNCLLIIQVPLKQEPPPPQRFNSAKIVGKVTKGASKWGEESSYMVKDFFCTNESATGVALPESSSQWWGEYSSDEEPTFSSKNKPKGLSLSDEMDIGNEDFWGDAEPNQPKPPRAFSSKTIEKEDAEHAMISVAQKSEGPYTELNGLKKLERDDRFPVRVTLQYYRATSNGVVTSSTVDALADQLKIEARAYASAIGSLVIAGPTARVTEPVLVPAAIKPPAWWDDFWLGHGPNYPHLASKEAAAALVFCQGRFAGRGLSECARQVCAILAASAPGVKPVVWPVMGGL